jgi:ribosome recycling factor
MKDGQQMIADIVRDAESRMKKAMDALQNNLGSIRTGRASPALVERIHVEQYGTTTPLNQLAGIAVPEARLLVIQPWDRGSIGPIERAILSSDIGLMPNNDGKVIRLSIPPLTEERRKQLVKQVGHVVEESKVAVRNIRRDAQHQARELLNKKEISEDDQRRGETELDNLTKKYVEETERIGQAKEQEILEV